MSSSKTESKSLYPNARKVILEILNATKGERCIFRGESVIYPGSISSSLYRQLKRENATTKNIQRLLKKRQNELIERIRSRTSKIGGDLEKLVASQHYGAKTNLLDFTENVFVALFFACWRDENEDGRVVIKHRRVFYELATEKDMFPDEKIALMVPPERYRRAADQNTVLLHAPKGFLSITEDETVLIRKEWKKEILELLENVHNISYETIFDDIEGVIERQNREDEIRTAADSQLKIDFEGIVEPDAEAYYNRGSAYATKLNPDYERAVLDYDVAISLDPNYSEAYNNRGFAYTKKFNPDHNQAIRDYTRAISLNPTYAEAYYNRGSAYATKYNPDYERAILDFTRAIELEPDYVQAYNNRGVVYRKKSNPEYDKAIRDFTRAIELEPEYAKAYNNRGNLYSTKPKPDYTRAIADYDSAIDLNPDYAEVYNNRGVSNYMKFQPDYKKALSDFNQALALAPRLATTYFLRGVVYAILGDGPKAKDDYNKAKSIDKRIADYPIPPELLKLLKSSTPITHSE